jgi:Ca-activated chloride channel homolog
MKKTMLIVMVCLYQLVVAAQSGSIRGTVHDVTQAVIPGAQIVVENLGTGEKRQALSDGQGDFEIRGLMLGKVRVSVSLSGFQTWVQEIQLGAAVAQLSVTLNIASAATMVEVLSTSTLQLSTSASVAGVVSGQRVAGVRRDIVNRSFRRMNTESYDYLQDNPFLHVSQQPRSTFAVDVDTASYANVRRFLTSGQLPPKDAVRIEELINYFKYAYNVPAGPHPVAIHTEVAAPFWEPSHRLVRIGLRAKDIDISRRPPANLVFLIDVSGSMQMEVKLPLVKRSLRLLVDELRMDDCVSIVVYAGTSGLVLPATCGDRKPEILNAIDRLEAGGSTNGGEGIQLAYRTAVANFVPNGINRVILATDGDFNVGVTNQGDLIRLIEREAQSGVFLTVLGFGIGNYKDSTLEKLADKGHGNYAYIDTFNEAKKVLVEQMSGTLLTVAKDVKLQIEFNPVEVQAYRLLGYENRLLRDEEFEDDNKKGGDMGAGHTVTALFEVVPVGAPFQEPNGRPLKYQKEQKATRARKGELLTVSLRTKQPDGNKSTLVEVPVMDSASTSFDKASTDFRFAASVAGFGMLLRDSPHKGGATWETVIHEAEQTKGEDPWRAEFATLAKQAALVTLK